MAAGRPMLTALNGPEQEHAKANDNTRPDKVG